MMWLGASLRSWMILAKVGFDRLQAVLFQVIVKLDLLGDHRLALGHDLRIDRAADFNNGFARFARRAAPVDLAAIGDHVVLEPLQIEVQVFQHVVLDVARLVAQRRRIPAGAPRLGFACPESRPSSCPKPSANARRRAPHGHCP